MARLVSCTEKERTREIHEKIRSIGGRKRDGPGWVTWSKSQAAAIAEIESGEQTYYVNIEGSTPNLVVGVHAGCKYLKAPVDVDAPTTLLTLPDC